MKQREHSDPMMEEGYSPDCDDSMTGDTFPRAHSITEVYHSNMRPRKGHLILARHTHGPLPKGWEWKGNCEKFFKSKEEK
jgi:hypothetical protein